MSKDEKNPDFGHADRQPSSDEAEAAERAEMGDETPDKYKEMAERGADAEGEGRID